MLILVTISQTTRSFPKPVKFSLYVGAVAVLCFFNWVALQAQGPSKNIENRLAAVLVEEVEAEIELESWMLTISINLNDKIVIVFYSIFKTSLHRSANSQIEG